MTSKQVERRIAKILRTHEAALKDGWIANADIPAFLSLSKLQTQLRWVCACERAHAEGLVAAAYEAVKAQSEYAFALKAERAVPRHEAVRDWRTL